MEDTATAEISRAQVWQWVHSPQAYLSDGRKVTKELVLRLVPEEIEKIKTLFGEKNFASGKFELARQIFEPLALNDQFIEFFTLAAYKYLE